MLVILLVLAGLLIIVGLFLVMHSKTQKYNADCPVKGCKFSTGSSLPGTTDYVMYMHNLHHEESHYANPNFA